MSLRARFVLALVGLVAVAIARRASPRPWPVEALHFTHFDDAPRSATGR